jgi:hypothetical protein
LFSPIFNYIPLRCAQLYLMNQSEPIKPNHA